MVYEVLFGIVLVFFVKLCVHTAVRRYGHLNIHVSVILHDFNVLSARFKLSACLCFQCRCLQLQKLVDENTNTLHSLKKVGIETCSWPSP